MKARNTKLGILTLAFSPFIVIAYITWPLLYFYGYILLLNGYYAIATSSLNALNTKFEFNDELKISLCNPTFRPIAFVDGFSAGGDIRSFSQDISIDYRTYAGEENITHPAFGASGYLVNTMEKINPYECKHIATDIRPFLEDLPLLQAQQSSKKVSMPVINAFRIHITIQNHHHPDGIFIGAEEVTLTSPWFEL